MSKITENYGTYLKALKQLREIVMPQQGNIRGVLRSLGKGATVALSVTAGVTLVMTFITMLYCQLAEIQLDFPTVIRGALALALSGFGASVSGTGGQLLSSSALDTVVTLGAHSGLIFVIAFLALRRVSKVRESDKDTAEVSPIHVAIGFAAFSWLTGFFAQGSLIYSSGAISLQALSLTSTVALFTFAWVASYRGKISSNQENSSAFGKATQWVSKALSNFMASYAVVTVLALVVAGISFAIQPVFAYATEPSTASGAGLPAGQTLLVVTGVLLFLINSIFQGLLGAMGLNVGLQIDGGGSNVYSMLDSLNLISAKTSLWLFTEAGVWAFIGVLLLVLVLALISGAAATSKTGVALKNTVNYWHALGYGTLVAFGVTYLMNVQFSTESSAQSLLEGESATSVSLTFGSTFVSVLVFSTIVLSLAFMASHKIYSFVTSAFPYLTARRASGEGLEDRKVSGRIFGLAVKLTLLAVALTPITAATTNRVWANIDGPTQVGQKFADNLQHMEIKDLKKYLNPKGSAASKWLSDKILKAAQPKEGFSSEINVQNWLKKDWTAGNLDANVKVTLSKDGKSFSYKFETESTVNEPSWLITHVDYAPILAPGLLKVVANSFLPKDKLKTLTVNGEKVQVGSYFSIPGTYTVKADGYKLLAPTDKTFYSSKFDALKIGYQIALPDGADVRLDKAILEKAQDCFKTSSTGSSKCIKVGDLNSSVESGNEPDSYFDFSDSKYSNKDTKCSAKRTDKLKSAVTEASSATCSTIVNFSRTYFAPKPKQIPKYIYESRCVSAMVSDYWMSYGEVLDYRDGWYGWAYYDSNDYFISSSDRHTEDCFSSYEVKVQDGYETIQVRGAKISATPMTAKFQKTMSVDGTLRNDGKFDIKK